MGGFISDTLRNCRTGHLLPLFRPSSILILVIVDVLDNGPLISNPASLMLMVTMQDIGVITA